MRYRIVSSSALLLCVAAATGFAQVRRPPPTRTKVPTLPVAPPALPVLSSFTLSLDSISGGFMAPGKVTLSGPAPAGGLEVTLTATDSAVTVPPKVVVAPGATERTFNIATHVVAAPTALQITARAGTASMSATLKVLLSVVSAAGEGYTPGSTTERIYRVTMSGPAPAAGIRVQPHVLGFPHDCYPLPVVSPALIAGGDASGVFTLQIPPSLSYWWAWELRYNYHVFVFQNFQGFQVFPAAVVAIDVPATLVGGTTGYGTVRLSRKTPNTGCAMSPQYSAHYDREFTVYFSSNSAAVQVPSSARVDPLQSERPFSITTSTVQTPQTATITASKRFTAGGPLQPIMQVTITVTP